MNKLFIIGNVANDPEYHMTNADKSVCEFQVAVNRRIRRDDEPEADFFRIVTFGKTADVCAKYVTKGKKISVLGAIQFNKYTDKNGINRVSHSVYADTVEFLSPRETEEKKSKYGFEEVSNDGLPF